MATLKFTAGTHPIGVTMANFIADTTDGDVILLLPTIAELLHFKQRYSGLNVAGTFNFAFEKIGNGKVSFIPTSREETINGIENLIVNEIGSGIIFISSDFGWGAVNFSKSSNQIVTAKIAFTAAQYDASTINAPIMIIPPMINSLIIPTHVVIHVTDGNNSDSNLGVGYIGKNGINLVSTIQKVEARVGNRIIYPIKDSQYFVLATDPVGLGVGIYKVSGGASMAGTIYIPSFDIVS